MHEAIAAVTPEIVEAGWPLTNVGPLTVLQQTPAGDRAVFLVESGEGRFVCKVASSFASRAGFERGLDAFVLLPQKGFDAVPRLVETRAGERYLESGGRFVFVLEYAGAGSPAATPGAYARLGALTARLHGVRGYPHRTPLDPEALVATDLQELAASLPFEREYLELVRSLPAFGRLPQAVIHTDIGTGNTIERADGELVLVDLDGVGTGPRVLDAGFPLIQQFVTEDCVFRPELADAFYGAYAARIRLTEEELRHVFPAALFLALRYVVYGDRDRRWRRILWAVGHRATLGRAYM